MTSDQELKQKIVGILMDADPEGLVPMGVPGDEYDSEAEYIMDRLAEATSQAEMSCLVARVFRQQFGYGESTDAEGNCTGESVPLYEEAELNAMYKNIRSRHGSRNWARACGQSSTTDHKSTKPE